MRMSRSRELEDAMRRRRDLATRGIAAAALAGLLMIGAIAMMAAARPAAGAADGPTRFASPEAAAAALAAGWQSGNSGYMDQMFGARGSAALRSGDARAEAEARSALAKAYDERHQIDSDGAGTAVLTIGAEAWPYPIPIVLRAGRWQFDAAAGLEEVLNRRIGRDELATIAVCRSYVEAQHEYAARARLSGGRYEYAQRLSSTASGRDGLYWPAPGDDEGPSPIGPLLAAAEGVDDGGKSNMDHQPFDGYYYRILTARAEGTPARLHSYVVAGHMTEGFALIAYPAHYGNSGVMTFLVDEDGVVYEKNLGARTQAIARSMKAYAVDASWRPVAP